MCDVTRARAAFRAALDLMDEFSADARSALAREYADVLQEGDPRGRLVRRHFLPVGDGIQERVDVFEKDGRLFGYDPRGRLLGEVSP